MIERERKGRNDDKICDGQSLFASLIIWCCHTEGKECNVEM